MVILFVVVPLIELWLLLRISSNAGMAFTLLLVIGTGMLGASLARRQGIRSWARIAESIREGKMPTEPLADGAMILVAGALLLTPGVLTDLFGFSLLFPPCRALYRPRLLRFLRTRFVPASPINQPTEGPIERDRIIDSYVIRPDEEQSSE